MSIVALKLIFTEDHDVDYMGDIDEDDLYAQVKADKILFHRWYKWLEDKFFEHTGIEKPLVNYDNELKRINSSDEGNEDEDNIFTSLVEDG